MRAEPGFTLVEVLVALAIFSLAALALLRLQGAALATTARLDDKTMAAITARNLAIAARIAAIPPSFGTSSGEDVNGGRRWRWTTTVARTPDPRLQSITITVSPPEGGSAATDTLVRRSQ